ncbi:uncharacterized protein LOC118647987 [Monomorium pharaonis]|uniref:uncharacterized protein LOC118647987 n=1 Tax=Monomorium pharaonis TaxID=307658 RepID=UPI001745FDD7|nr:uncharacterized protein LOC118647987 [Monomorium pharaonis]XP_036150091.1 uncharacterized protein LOC118647987 [Monomorium pharaonis]
MQTCKGEVHLKAFYNVQSAQAKIIYEQKSSNEVSLPTSDSNSNISFLTTDFPFSLSHSPTNEESSVETLQIPFKINAGDCLDKHTSVEANLEKEVSKLDDNILDLIDVRSVKAPFKELDKNAQQTQLVIFQEQLQSKNPLFILLLKNKLHTQEPFST